MITSALFDSLQVELEDNILRDGTMIDLCGATLIWRSSSSLQASPVSIYKLCSVYMYTC